MCQKAPIDPFTRERCKPSASQGVPLGGMGYAVVRNYAIFVFLPRLFRFFLFIFDSSVYRSGSISRGFRGEFKHWQIIPGSCEMSPVMANQFSVTLQFFSSIMF